MNHIKLFFIYGVGLFVFLMTTELNAQSSFRQRGVAPQGSFTSSRSGILFDFGIYYGQDEATANPNVGNEYIDNRSIYDIKLGYVFGNDVYFGGEYSVQNANYVGGSSTGHATAIGLGYFFSNNFNLRAYYRINETYSDYSEGTGFQADLSYLINVSSNFYFGLIVSHRQTTYKTNYTIAQFEEWTAKSTNPALAFGFLVK